MRTRTYLYIGITAAVAALAGCASTPTAQPYNPRHSEALNVARAAGMTDIRDIPWEQYQKIRAEARVHGSQIDERSLVGPSISALATYFSNVRPFGLAPGGAGALDFVMMLSRPDKASSSSQLLAWMPREMASSPEEAQAKLTDILVTAMRKAAVEANWPSGMRVVMEDIQVETDPWKRNIFVPISGAACDNEMVRCALGAFRGTKAPELKTAPAWLGGGGVYAFAAKTSSHSSTWSLTGRSYRELSAPKGDAWYRDRRTQVWRAVLPDIEFYGTVSKHLPDWAYLYLTPANETISIPAEEGKRTFLKVPLVLHQGKVLFFIEPEPRAIAASR